jgi:hypothetical protein
MHRAITAPRDARKYPNKLAFEVWQRLVWFKAIETFAWNELPGKLKG